LAFGVGRRIAAQVGLVAATATGVDGATTALVTEGFGAIDTADVDQWSGNSASLRHLTIAILHQVSPRTAHEAIHTGEHG
jgi:hypothetical protein